MVGALNQRQAYVGPRGVVEELHRRRHRHLTVGRPLQHPDREGQRQRLAQDEIEPPLLDQPLEPLDLAGVLLEGVSGVIVQRGRPPQGQCSFAHALAQRVTRLAEPPDGVGAGDEAVGLGADLVRGLEQLAVGLPRQGRPVGQQLDEVVLAAGVQPGPGDELARVKVAPGFRLDTRSASAWIEGGFRRPG